METGWLLPENPFPEKRICVQFEIPDDIQYVAVINGLLADLGKWWNWEKGGDTDRRATNVAAMFRKIIYETLCIERYHEMGCNCPDRETWQHRISDTGTLERSTDGGVTWEPDPADPRTTATILPELPGTDGDAKRCLAATNVRGNMKIKADQLAADATAWSGLTGMIGALVAVLIFIGVIGSAGALTPIVLAFGAALLAGGQAAFTAAMTDAVFDTFQCIVYCHMDENGLLKPNGLSKIVSDLNDQVTGIANTFLVQNVQLLQENGINNMGKVASGVDPDCTGCSDCSCIGALGFNAGSCTIVSIDEATCTLVLQSVVDPGNAGRSVIGFDFGAGCGKVTTLASDNPAIRQRGWYPCGAGSEVVGLFPEGSSVVYFYEQCNINTTWTMTVKIEA